MGADPEQFGALAVLGPDMGLHAKRSRQGRRQSDGNAGQRGHVGQHADCDDLGGTPQSISLLTKQNYQ